MRTYNEEHDLQTVQKSAILLQGNKREYFKIFNLLNTRVCLYFLVS